MNRSYGSAPTQWPERCATCSLARSLALGQQGLDLDLEGMIGSAQGDEHAVVVVTTLTVPAWLTLGGVTQV